MNFGISKEMQRSMIWNFMDLLILKELGKGLDLSAQDFVSLFHKKFHTSVNLGSMHSLLYAMESEGLIEGTMHSGKRTYKLTEKGKNKIRDVLLNLDNILSFLRFALDPEGLSKLL